MSSTGAQGVRYLIVGAYNVAFTLAVFWLLDRLWGGRVDVQITYWTSAILGNINGFVFQRIFVWRSAGQWHRELARFAIVNISVAAANSLLLVLAVTVWRFPAFPSQVVITGMLVIATFFVNRGWVFRTDHHAPGDRNGGER